MVLVIRYISKKECAGLKHQYLKHSNIYLLGHIIMFYQYYIDCILEFVSEDLSQIWVDPSVVCKSISLSNIGLVSFQLGYMLQKKKHALN